jgi:hypothetical protein
MTIWIGLKPETEAFSWFGEPAVPEEAVYPLTFKLSPNKLRPLKSEVRFCPESQTQKPDTTLEQAIPSY